MTAETLRAEVIEALVALAWDQWGRLGVSVAAPSVREMRAADPEALLLFTLEIGRSDPRLFDEVLDWLAANAHLMSVQRLRNLCANTADRGLVDSALVWVARSSQRARLRSRAKAEHRDDLEPLFHGTAARIADIDPAFAEHGFSRPQLHASGKSQPPALVDPIAFAFRLRRLLGVGVRAEVVRTLLTVRAPRISGRVISASAGFAQRNVREGLLQLHEAGVVAFVDIGDDRHYAADTDRWATLLGIEPPELPRHYDWIPTLRALTAIVRWLQRPGIDDLSDYLRASQARTLMAAIDPDLRYSGVTVIRGTGRGAEYWSEFEAQVMAAVAHARGGP